MPFSWLFPFPSRALFCSVAVKNPGALWGVAGGGVWGAGAEEGSGSSEFAQGSLGGE